MKNKEIIIRKIGKNQYGIYYIPKRCRNWRYFPKKIANRVLPKFKDITIEQIKNHLEKNIYRWLRAYMSDIIGEPIIIKSPIPSIFEMLLDVETINEK